MNAKKDVAVKWCHHASEHAASYGGSPESIEPGDLPTGVIVGTVEVVGCRKVRGEYEWDLAKPVRLKRQLKPRNHPQPGWFNPF